jgi:glycosyltransferase involved in cell wall biosynthesis
MKVLHTLDSLNRGGAEMMTLDVCRNARANGLDLTFLATGGGDLEADFRNSGVEFIRLERKRPIDLALVAQIRQIIKARNIQVVHSHQPVEALHLYFATRDSNIKRVMTLHGVSPGAKNELALRFVLPRTDGCVVISNDLHNAVAHRRRLDKKKRFLVISNGVDPKRLELSDRNLRDELGITSDSFLIGMVANFSPVARKDQMTVCQALPRIFKALPRAHFVFVGSRSPAAPQLFDGCVQFCRREGISERTHFLGKRSDVTNVLRALDVFVLSSEREGSPISVIEAMMMGLPTVLSDIAALREVSNDAACAELFRTGDREDLATKLISLAEKTEYRARLGAQAKQWATENFSIGNHIANLKRFYGSVTSIGPNKHDLTTTSSRVAQAGVKTF